MTRCWQCMYVCVEEKKSKTKQTDSNQLSENTWLMCDSLSHYSEASIFIVFWFLIESF